MCGIMSIASRKNNIQDYLIDGLKIMEYRGYDSCGISWVSNHEIKEVKSVGRVASLENMNVNCGDANVGIAHTRWATHGSVNLNNAHPHSSNDNKFSLVHNGIITNYLRLKREYLSDYEFKSDTDSEVIVQLISKFSKDCSFENAVIKTIGLLQGSFALAILNNESNYMLVAKEKSPLLIGVGEYFNISCSDINVIAKYCTKFYELNDKQIVKVDSNNIEVIQGDSTLKENNVNQSDFNIDKDNFEHYMLKEIHEQPQVIRNLISIYIDQENHALELVLKRLREVRKIYLIASGTSYHACLVAKDYFEKFANISTEVFIASEFAYNIPLIAKNAAFVFISQSGETADSIACIKNIEHIAKYKLLLTNSKHSTMARMCDDVLDLAAGPEIAVASTKAYSAQVALLAIVACGITKTNIKKELNSVVCALEKILMPNSLNYIKSLTKDYIINSKSMFYLGRWYDYYVSLEAALKIKEISYINATGYAGGELKHGPIALIEKDTPVVGIICSNPKINAHLYSNLKEVETRGAKVITISFDQDNGYDNIYVDRVSLFLSPLISVVPTQLIAYYSALLLGHDVDKPRNLAKSVTVE